MSSFFLVCELVSLHLPYKELFRLNMISRSLRTFFDRPGFLSLLQVRWPDVLHNPVPYPNFSSLLEAIDIQSATPRSYKKERLGGRSHPEILSQAASEGDLSAVKLGLALVLPFFSGRGSAEKDLRKKDCWLLGNALMGCDYEMIHYLLTTYSFTYQDYFIDAVATTAKLGPIVQDEIFALYLKENPPAPTTPPEDCTLLKMFPFHVLAGAAYSGQLELLKLVIETGTVTAENIEDAYYEACTGEGHPHILKYLHETYQLSYEAYIDTLPITIINETRDLYDLVLRQTKERLTLTRENYSDITGRIIRYSHSERPGDKITWLFESMRLNGIKFSEGEVLALITLCGNNKPAIVKVLQEHQEILGR